jgi:hypothetical protein
MVVAGERPVVGVIAGAFGLELAGGTHDLSAAGAPAAGDGLVRKVRRLPRRPARQP